MYARQLVLPGLEARIENDQLTVETEGFDQHCGRGLLYAKTWALWTLQAGKHESVVGKEHQERSAKP